MIAHRALLFQAIIALCLAGDSPKQPDWPTLPPIPAPMPAVKVDPAVVQSLSLGQLYVVQSDEEVQLLASPEGIVKITQEAGPIRIHGKFVDGKQRETRLYSKKQVFIVERMVKEDGTAVAGDVELLLAPKGPIVRRVITDAQNPIPPPKPVDPKPVDPPTPKVKSPWDNAPGLRVLVVYPANKNLTVDQTPIISGIRTREYLDSHCAKENGEAAYWLIKTGEDVSGLDATWQAAFKLADNRTYYVIGNGDRWEHGPLPATVDAFLAILKKYE